MAWKCERLYKAGNGNFERLLAKHLKRLRKKRPVLTLKADKNRGLVLPMRQCARRSRSRQPRHGSTVPRKVRAP